MDKNKSIDGLVTRRVKKTAAPVSNPSKSKKTTNSSKAKTATKTTRKTTAKKPATAKKPSVKTTKPNSEATKSISPISPVTTIEVTETPTESINEVTSETLAEQSPEPVEESPKTTESITEDFLKPIQAFDFDEKSGKLKASTATAEELHEKPKKAKKKMSKKRKIILSIIITILTILIAGTICFIIWGNDIIAKITGGQGNVFDLIFQDETYEPLKTDENGRTNILAFGTSGYDMEGSEGYGIHDGAQLTDSIMVISLDQETGDVAMLSLPRDLKSKPICTSTGKINEVYWCNNMEGDNESAGAEALTNEVGEILGIDFQYYAHLNWGSLVNIVNTLGGITITLDEDIEDYYYTKAVFEAGVPYTITGEEALGLARARHGTTSGDFSRGASQQKILIGIKDKLLEKKLSVTELVSLASTLGDNLRTNFSVDELKTLAHLLSEFDFNNIRQVSLIEPENYMTTGTINGISYVLPVGGAGYYTKIQNYVAKMFSSDPRKYEDASILVLNGTDTAGLASSEQSTLEEEGYTDIAVNDAPEGSYSEEYSLYDLTNSAPGTKKLLETKYKTTAKTAEELPANIPTDYDFIIILGNSNK